MAVGTAAAIALGGMAAGGVAGAIKGAQGTPEQRVNSELGAMTPEQQQAIRDSLASFQAGQAGIGQQEQDILARMGLQNQSRDVLGQALGGSLFQMTPQEQAQLESIRNSQIATGQTEIGRLLEQGLGRTEASAAARGVRGQALSELQGQQTNIASQRLQDVINQANQGFASGAMNLPMQRAAQQIGIAGQGASFADQLRQQALQNRLQFQTPGALSTLSNERIAGASKVIPGQEGSFGDALIGLIGGIGGTGQAVGNVGGGIANLQKAFPGAGG